MKKILFVLVILGLFITTGTLSVAGHTVQEKQPVIHTNNPPAPPVCELTEHTVQEGIDPGFSP